MLLSLLELLLLLLSLVLTVWSPLQVRGASKQDTQASSGAFKAAQRAQLCGRYEIIASVGDQESDFAGGHAGYAVKLPNIAYSIN